MGGVGRKRKKRVGRRQKEEVGCWEDEREKLEVTGWWNEIEYKRRRTHRRYADADADTQRTDLPPEKGPYKAGCACAGREVPVKYTLHHDTMNS